MKKFMFIAPTSNLTPIHLNRPFFQLCKSMIDSGWISILVAGKISNEIELSFKTYETGVFDNTHLGIFRAFKPLYHFLVSENPDLVVFFHMNLLIPFFIVLWKFKHLISSWIKQKSMPKWVIKLDWDGTKFSNTGPFLMYLRNLFASINSHLVDYMVVESSCGFDSLSNLKFVDVRKIKVIPNTFSTDFNVSKYDNGKREDVILCVARIIPEKGLEYLLESFARIRPLAPTWRLKIVGPTIDDAYRSRLELIVKRYSFHKYVDFMGPLYGDSLMKMYERASIFCLPSLKESFGIVRAEAIAMGIPIITTIAGCGEDFKNYGSIVVPMADVDSLSDSLISLIKNPCRRETISIKQQEKFPRYDYVTKRFRDLI